MNFDALFTPRIRPTIAKRLAWLKAQFKSELACIDSGELIRQLGHAGSAHGIAFRQLLKHVSSEGHKKVYELDPIAWKTLVAKVMELEQDRSMDAEFATRLRQQHVDLVLRVDAAEQTINEFVKSEEPRPAEEYYRALADAGILSQALKGIRSAINAHSTHGRQAAELELDRFVNVRLSSGELLLACGDKPFVLR